MINQNIASPLQVQKSHGVSQWQKIAPKFEAVVGKKGVVQRQEELLTYECDSLTSYRQRPALVVLPRTTEQVAEVVKICYENQIPWVTRGAGTGLSGGALPVEDCVLIVTTLMNKILKVDLENQRIIVQAGVINNWVTQAISGKGFYYAPDPSSQTVCTIGGNIAENAGGIHCLKYGVTTNHVLGLKLVIPDGSVVDVGGIISEMPGYDLTGLFIGSEGTLGIATEITLRIIKTPEAIGTVLADFTTIEAAGDTVTHIISAGIIPAAMELMDGTTIKAIEDVINTGCYPRDAAAVLLIEVDGLGVEVESSKQQVAKICQQNGARNVIIASDEQRRIKLWQGRKTALIALGYQSHYFLQDGVIPRTQLVAVLKEISALGNQYGYRIANALHAGDGNLHPVILYDHAVPGAFKQVEELSGEILKLCVRVGGSISGEHGIGADKKCLMPEMFNHIDLDTMQWPRLAFNPQGLANPGKMFPTPPTCGEAAQAQKMGRFSDLEVF
ncbi:FAD-linked oxidase C-terminal domain-containing protein [Planktothrix pseudagardhii]|uniref:Glycolate oxidase subunit GlcD n=1 Tax=Planktothrix pseudagardhii TaxID=132604 RepID=A0A9W4CRW2_9CYAN|nr:FAD-linked oxidase C-terminal domain-containing protein [Planktothrix pseudagardhii]CAD5956096.1 Glycolate oxidase subunit GlcD [Planktothrix pseudagardhii]